MAWVEVGCDVIVANPVPNWKLGREYSVQYSVPQYSSKI